MAMFGRYAALDQRRFHIGWLPGRRALAHCVGAEAGCDFLYAW